MGWSLQARDRRSLRRAVRTECQVVTERSFTLLGVIAIDLSPDGMLVASDVDVPVGEPLFVSLRIPGTSMWVDAEAVVTRLVRGVGVGVELTRVEPAARALLAASLQGHPPPVPRCPERRDYAAAVRAIGDLTFGSMRSTTWTV